MDNITSCLYLYVAHESFHSSQSLFFTSSPHAGTILGTYLCTQLGERASIHACQLAGILSYIDSVQVHHVISH